jgi:hypothetical protein
MDNNKSDGAVADFLKEVNDGQEDDSIVEKPDTDVFGDKIVETEVPEAGKEEKTLPFHKDPKVQRYVEREIAKRIKDVKLPEPKESARETIKESDSLLEAFAIIVGNDTPEKKMALDKLARGLSERDEKTYKRAVGEFQTIQNAEIERDKAAQKELNQGFEDIEEEYEVDLTSNTPQAKKMRIDFSDFILRIAPKDSDGSPTGYPDMIQAFDLFRERATKKPATNKAKELASRGMERSGDASNAKPSGAITWDTVDKMMSKMNK